IISQPTAHHPHPYSFPTRRSSDLLNKTYDYKNPVTLISYRKIRKGSIHPTQKPVALFEYLIKTYTNEGETVLDNCMGSGTTAIACINTNRNYIGFELDEEYYKTSIERINNHAKDK